MRAYHLTAPTLDALVRVDLPRPTAGPGEILIRLGAASLNFLDLAVASGQFPVPAFPLIPVTDGAGTVEAVGEGVAGFNPGDRIIPHLMPQWQGGTMTPEAIAMIRGVTAPGSLADFVVVPAAGAARAPAHLSLAEAAALPIAGTTAWNAVRAGRVRPGSVVVLQGTGGVSLLALQFAKAAGARVIITSSSDAKLERARALGADETLNYRTTPDWASEVKRLTQGRGGDLIIETGGAETFAASLEAAAIGGVVFVIGFLTGGVITAPVFPILGKTLTLKGNNTGSVADFRDMLRAVETLRLRPVVDRVFPFEEARGAYELQARGGHFGKLAIACD